MAQTFVQGNHNETVSSASSLTCAFTSNNSTANNLLVYTAIWDSGASVNPTYSDTPNNSIVDSGNGVLLQTSGVFKIQTLCVLACKTGANTLTISFSGTQPGFIGLTVSEFNDSVNTGGWTIDKFTGTTGFTAAPASGPVTTTHTTEVVFGWAGGDGSTLSAGTGFTAGETNQATLTSFSEYEFLTSTASPNATFGSGGTQINWAAQIVTLFANAAAVTSDDPPAFKPKAFPPQWNRDRQLLLHRRAGPEFSLTPETNPHFIPRAFPPQWNRNLNLLRNTRAGPEFSLTPETNPHFISRQLPPQWSVNKQLFNNAAVDVQIVSAADTFPSFVPRAFPPQWNRNRPLPTDVSPVIIDTPQPFILRSWPPQWLLIRQLLQNPALDVTPALIADTPPPLVPRSFPPQWSLIKWQLQNPALDIPLATQQDTPSYFTPLQWPNEWKIDLALVHAGAQDETSAAVETNPPWRAKSWSVQWLPCLLLLHNPALDVTPIQPETPTYFSPIQWQSQWDVNVALVQGGSQDQTSVAVETNTHFIPRQLPLQWNLNRSLAQNTAQDLSTPTFITNTYFSPIQWQSQWDVDVSLVQGGAQDGSTVVIPPTFIEIYENQFFAGMGLMGVIGRNP